ncbi:MAG: N-acetylglucosamine-6-phosphate deacetylase [Bacteroidales bacterium]|nr:N-acetylglucosamine-6-phosphate deacetylase [Bacteroidales bacterium]
MLRAFINADIFTGEEIISGKVLVTDGKRIRSLIEPQAVTNDMEVVNCNNCYISPGLIDLQIAGSGGRLFSSEPTVESLDIIAGSIVKTGTTGFLVALPTNSPEVYRNASAAVRENRHPAVLGLHFEGPFISQYRKGAHMREYIRAPQPEDLNDLLNIAGGTMKMMTIAPEVCSEECVKILLASGVTVAAGHSNATFKEAMEGFSRGVKVTTHLFNAMSQLHHRDPGLPGATFVSENACASIIADGIHVDYSMLTIAKKLMNERLFLVSDAVEENINGAYRHVKQHDRFTLPDGTLSGSKLTMLDAVRNCVNNAGIMPDEALRMATLYPARVMNLSDRGKLAPGYRADMIIIDKNFRLVNVYLEGEPVT